MLFKKMSLLMVALALTLTACSTGSHEAANPSPSPSVSASATPSPTPSDLGLSEKDAKQVAKALSDIYQDYKPDEVAMGGAKPIPKSREERGPASFTKKTIQTREDLVAFFNSSRPKAAAARKRVELALRKAGYKDDEVTYALTKGDRWIWVAPTVESQVLGTTYFVEGKVLKANNWRQTAPNDAIWFYVTRDAKIVPEAAVRADCGNPEVKKVRPVRPTTPPAPPIECVGNCGKDHRLSPVSSDPNDPEERVRPVVSPPPTVIRPTSGPGSTPQPTTEPTMASDPPEVSSPKPAATQEPTAPATSDPAENCDKDGDGIPDDNC